MLVPRHSKRDYHLLFKSPVGTDRRAVRSGNADGAPGGRALPPDYSSAQITAFEDSWHWGEQAEREFDELLHQPNTAVAEMMKALRVFLGENDMMAYLTMMANRLRQLHRVLKPTGSLLAQAFEQEGAYVQSESGGDEAKILSSGFGVRGAAAPISPVGQVLNLAVTEGDNPGSVDGQWDPVEGKKTYEVAFYVGADPATGTYTQAAPVTASRTTLTGLSSGSRVWVKARALGAAGPGPWSDPATKIVP